jgi:threonine dehydratase
LITLDTILAARERIRLYVHKTPLLTSHTLNERSGNNVWLKCENFQRCGSFKIRGAFNKISQLTPEQRMSGVVAFSSGNHAQGVALSAKLLRIHAIIAMPTDAPTAKVEATKAYGADIVFYDRQRENREEIARRLAEEKGAVLIPPYDDEDIIAGQGTIFVEIAEELKSIDYLVLPCGGGGLLSGNSIAAKALMPNIKVIGVETEAANDTFLSFRAGHRVAIPTPTTIADGMRHNEPGKLTFPLVQRYVDDIALVSDEEVMEAMRFLLFRTKILVEPTGAVAVAAVIHNKINVSNKNIVVVLSGGNVDAVVLNQVLQLSDKVQY